MKRIAVVVGGIMLALPAGAQAGRLSKVTHAVKSKSGGKSSGGARNGRSGSSGRSRARPDYEPRYRAAYAHGAICVTCPTVSHRRGREEEGPAIDPQLDLFFGAQSVEGSDGAGLMSVRLSGEVLGIGASDASFFERIPGENIRMDVFSIHGSARVLDYGAGDLWIEGGLGGARSNQFETLLGPTLGAELEHRFSERFAAIGGARFFFLEEETRARELRAALRAGFLQVGYRRLAFDVGPPLQGPEAGVALRF